VAGEGAGPAAGPGSVVSAGHSVELHTGIGWKDLPQELGFGSGVTGAGSQTSRRPATAGTERRLHRDRESGRRLHLFVIVPGLAGTALFEVKDLLIRPGAPLPTATLSLPAEVTHVWVMSTWSEGRGFRWSPDAGCRMGDVRQRRRP
jgi:hypothetical protein